MFYMTFFGGYHAITVYMFVAHAHNPLSIFVFIWRKLNTQRVDAGTVSLKLSRV